MKVKPTSGIINGAIAREGTSDKLEFSLLPFRDHRKGGAGASLTPFTVTDDDYIRVTNDLVSDVTAEGMTIANVAVGFNENTEFEGEDDSISVERFIELVQSNPAVIVEVEGEYDGDTLIAAKVEVETVGGQDGDDDGDDNDDSSGKAEFEGEIESIEGDSVFVNGNELRFSQDTEFELNDEEVDLQTFYDALEVGVVIEIEGVWVDQSYIKVTEAELETNDGE